MSDRARSFDGAAADYERYRPGYPREALAWAAGRLGLRSGARVLDLGAGTGKLTRGLLALGLDAVAVEPGPPMLAQLRAALPQAEAHEGAAESIPLPDASVDAAAAGQAYHWFDPERAVPELHRVLRPGGGVALLWNWWDVRDPLQRRMGALVGVGDGRPDASHPTLAATGLFEPLDETVVESVHETTADDLVGRIATTSAVLTATPERREELLGELRALAAERGERFELPLLTFVHLYRRLG